METLMKMLKQKTTWAALAYIAATAVPAFQAGNYTVGVQAVIIGLGAIFMRQAVAKVTKDIK